MLTFNDLPVENLVWSAIEPSQCYKDFVAFVRHFPSAHYERRHYAINQACALHSFDALPESLYPRAYAALQEIARETDSDDTRRRVLFQLGKMNHNGCGTDRDCGQAVRYYEQAIALGEVRSMVNLAIHYWQGDESDRNIDRARELFQRAADLGETQSLVCLADMIEEIDDPQKSLLVERAVEMGCPFAMSRLSQYFFKGRGGKAKDLQQADAWMMRSAKAGNGYANFCVGGLHEHGLRGEVNLRFAADWYRQGEAFLYPECMGALGVMHLFGAGVEQDRRKGRALLMRAALLGDLMSQRRLGEDLLLATEEASEHVLGYNWLKQAADAGNMKACENLFSVYMRGRGTQKDPQQALHYVRLAAEEGFPDAQWQLAAAHWFDGDGIEANHDEAFKWLSICATQGDARGICFLGHAYREGVGCKVDVKEAAKLFAEAAEMDYAPAIQALGRCYFYGDGVDKDPAKGMALLRDAANRGETRAMFDIGVALANGEHVLTNYEEAMKWFRRAADQGDRNAMFFVGRMYEEGDGVEQDLDEARRWIGKAAAKGHYRALEWLTVNTPEKPQWLSQIIQGAIDPQTQEKHD